MSFLSNDCFKRLSEAIELNIVDLREDLRLEEEEEAASASGVSGTIVIILKQNSPTVCSCLVFSVVFLGTGLQVTGTVEQNLFETGSCRRGPPR